MNKYEEALENVRAEWGTSDRDIDILEELVDRATPKKLDYEATGYYDGELVYDMAYCPICHHEFEYEINDWGCDYCSDCGQALDWSKIHDK